MSSAGFEPAIPANKRPQTYALERAATGIVHKIVLEDQVKVDEMGSACRACREEEKCVDLVGKRKDNRPIGRPRYRIILK
jgi:hypothetical protein